MRGLEDFRFACRGDEWRADLTLFVVSMEKAKDIEDVRGGKGRNYW